MLLRRCCLLLSLLAAFSPPSIFAEQNTANPSGTYVLAYRTPAHQKYSTLDVFDEAVSQLNEYFQTKKVVCLVDPERGIVSTQGALSTDNMLALAKNAGASIVLLVTVDRPKTSWIKVTVQAID